MKLKLGIPKGSLEQATIASQKLSAAGLSVPRDLCTARLR